MIIIHIITNIYSHLLPLFVLSNTTSMHKTEKEKNKEKSHKWMVSTDNGITDTKLKPSYYEEYISPAGAITR